MTQPSPGGHVSLMHRPLIMPSPLSLQAHVSLPGFHVAPAGHAHIDVEADPESGTKQSDVELTNTVVARSELGKVTAEGVPMAIRLLVSTVPVPPTKATAFG